MSHDASSGRALHGIRVLDFGQYIAGPLTARLLAEAGASVTHVDPPGGPRWNSEANRVLNRGKTVECIDLKSAAGLNRAFELVRDADVLVENFAPGVFDRLGLSAAVVKAANPRCIYLSMPGFCSSDSGRAELKAFEAVIMTESGVFADMGLNRTLMGVNPSYSPLPLASTYAAPIAANAVTAALISRELTGLGDHLEIPLAACLHDTLIYNAMDLTDVLPARYLCARQREINRRTALGLPMNLSYGQVMDLLDPFYCTYQCKDDRMLYLVAPCHAVHQERTLKILGLWDEMLARDIPRGGVWQDCTAWEEGVLMMLGTYPISDDAWASMLKMRMAAVFSSRPAAEWESIFGSMKVPAAEVKSACEWLQSEHALASGLVVKRTITLDSSGSAADCSNRTHEAVVEVTTLEASTVVWHKSAKAAMNDVALEQSRKTLYSKMVQARMANTEDTLSNQCLWLRGVKVVDFCNVIAGPMIGCLLARMGADVVKVDPAKPSYDALVAVYMGICSNRGKRSLLADLKHVSSMELLRRLVVWADIVLCNQVQSQLAAVGLTEENLKRMNPRVIVTRFDAFGGPNPGPKSNHVGYDDLLQASTGIMERFGGGLKIPEEHAHLGTIDVVSGWSGAFATCLALFKRLRTGHCDMCYTSLAANAQLIQTPFMFLVISPTKEEVSIDTEARGAQVQGDNALYQFYATANSHVFVAAPFAEQERAAAASNLMRLIGLDIEALGPPPPARWCKHGTEKAQNAAWSQAIADRLIDMDTSSVVDLAKAAGMTACPLTTMQQVRITNVSDDKEFFLSPSAGRAGEKQSAISSTFHFYREMQHPIGGAVTMFSPCSVLSARVRISVTPPTFKYGQHTVHILRDLLGFSSLEVQAMLDIGCCSTSWCEDYIPGGDPWKKKEVEQDRVRKKVAHRVKIQKLMPAPSSPEQMIVTSPELHSQHATPQLKAEKHSQYDVDALPDLV